MKQKSITFRCTAPQHERLEAAMEATETNRTGFIVAALTAFLNYTDREEIRSKNLFELVKDIDALGNGGKFEDFA
jgi:uncharacterized protein (DUF1778 family)